LKVTGAHTDEETNALTEFITECTKGGVILNGSTKLFEFLRVQGYGVLPLPDKDRGIAFLVNTTAHPVCILDGSCSVKYVIPKAVRPLRLAEVIEELEPLAGVPMVRKKLDAAQELPPRLEGVFYIVSLGIAQAALRADFLVPDCKIRSPKGRTVGCKRLAVVFEAE